MPKRKEIPYLHNLIAIAYSDKTICIREIIYLKRRAAEFGVSEHELTQMIRNAGEFELVAPLEFENKMKFLNDCVDMALADGVMSDREYEMCKNLCLRMGLYEIHLQECIALKKVTIL